MKRYLLSALVLIGLSGKMAHSQMPQPFPPPPLPNRSSPNFLQQIQGPVRISVVRALIAPVKPTTYNGWDSGGGPNPVVVLPPSPMAAPLKDALFRAMQEINPLDAVSQAMHWPAGVWDQSVAAPDVQLQVLFDGKPILFLPKVQDSYVPTWSEVRSEIVIFNNSSNLSVTAVDSDIALDDPIGACVSRGIPYEDGRGFLHPRSIGCSGGLWGLLLRISPVDPG